MLFDINEFEQELQSESHITVITLNAKKIKELPFKLGQLRKTIAQYNPDIVHSQLYWSNVLARLATPKKTPLFFTNQSLQRHEAFSKAFTIYLEKMTYASRHSLLSVSKAVEDEYKEFIGIKGRHYILRNFADDVFFKGTKTYCHSDGQFNFVTVGRLHHQKNQRLLVEAFSTMPAKYTLSIYGKGPLEEKLKGIAEQNGAHNIRFWGVQSKMYEVLRDYDVFVMASFYEGFSLAVVEAMASGLPVLLPDSPVFHEMAGDAGVYFDNNSVDNLQQKIKAICVPERLNEMSARSVAQAENIGRKDNFLKKLRALYES